MSLALFSRNREERLRLEAWRCGGCGRILFPAKPYCPHCGVSLEASGAAERVTLTGHGVILAATWVAGSGAPAEFADVARRAEGYGVALVELQEGVRVIAQLAGPVRTTLQSARGQQLPAPGTPGRMVLRRLYAEDGAVRYGYKFILEEA